MRPPFGVRKGVMAIYMLDCLLHLDDMPIIYFNNKEVIVDVDTINNIIRKPSEYYLYVELETVQKNEYIHGLEVLFTDFDVYCREVDKRNQLAKISCMMPSWVPPTATDLYDVHRARLFESGNQKTLCIP